MKKTIRVALLLGFLFGSGSMLKAQDGSLEGQVQDGSTGEPLVAASVLLEGTQLGAYTDAQGRFVLSGIPRGTYALQVSYLGYQTWVERQILIEGGVAQVSIRMVPQPTETDTIRIQANRFTKTSSNLISSRSLGVEQIRTNPGGNFDISRVVQNLPGVSGSVGFRNDILVRGGAPNENVFYLDGIEIPNINHFATQGSGGGPVGIINSIFIENVDFQSSAFDARFDNTLSSVLDFRFIEGNRQRLQTTALLSATEAGITLDGPAGNKLRGIVSARRSYLQFLFDAIGLPFLPDYYDFQGKMTWDVGNKTSVNFIGIGAIDRITLAKPDEAEFDRLYLLDGFPKQSQDTYTMGTSIRHLTPSGYYTLALSRNWLSNRIRRDNLITGVRVLDFESVEAENKLRLNVVSKKGDWLISYGLNSQYGQYTNSSFIVGGADVRDTVAYENEVGFMRYGAYGSISRRFAGSRLLANLGVRTDLNNYTDGGNNPLRTLSPRLSLSYSLTDQWRVNGSVGVYYKLPSYTILGFEDNGGMRVNRDADYIRSLHYVAGLEYQPGSSTLFSLEGFYKQYDDYPVSLDDSISLANKGGDFGVFGDEAVRSVGRGRSYGVEVFAQQQLAKRLYGTVAYTIYRSEFTGLDSDEYIRSSWDNRHLISLTGGYQLGRKKNWEIAVKWRYLGGAPYTPWDIAASTEQYLVTGEPVLDNRRVNAEQTAAFNQVDLRLERKFFFKKWSLIAFIDLQNITSSPNSPPPNFTLERDPATRQYLSPARPQLVEDEGSTLIPSIGLRARF
ncbi:MAG: TonB-dependent receptor [Bacteroidetes bacterium]|jgi:hypothetical protein|nr:TonB-dependent receptor [Bacteroidota bacterium]